MVNVESCWYFRMAFMMFLVPCIIALPVALLIVMLLDWSHQRKRPAWYQIVALVGSVAVSLLTLHYAVWQYD